MRRLAISAPSLAKIFPDRQFAVANRTAQVRPSTHTPSHARCPSSLYRVLLVLSQRLYFVFFSGPNECITQDPGACRRFPSGPTGPPFSRMLALSRFGLSGALHVSFRTLPPQCGSIVAPVAEIQGALIASFRHFHELNEGLWQSRYGGSLAVHSHCFSADATNRAVWMGSKLMSCELESIYCAAASDFDDGKPFHQVWSCKRQFTDTLKVRDETTVGTHNLLHKALVGVGCPTWVNCAETSYDDTGFGDGQYSIREYLYTSDGGPDEIRFKKVMYVVTMDSPHVLFFPGSCFMHGAQLWVRSGLGLADVWLKSVLPDARLKYFATLSKLAQIWRDNAGVIYELAAEISPVLASKYCRKMVPRCIAGRWQSSHATEVRLREIGRTLLTQLLNSLFDKKAQSKKRKKRADTMGILPLEDACDRPASAPSGAVVLEDDIDPMNETCEQHIERMTRWRADVKRAVNNTLFWAVLQIHSTVNEVVEHLMRFLGASYTNDQLVADGNQTARLLECKGVEFMSKYEALVRNPDPFQLLAEPSFRFDSEHPDFKGMVGPLAGFAILLTMHHAANLQRRVNHVVMAWPTKLALFAKFPPREPCEHRRGQQGAKSVLHQTLHTVHRRNAIHFCFLPPLPLLLFGVAWRRRRLKDKSGRRPTPRRALTGNGANRK